MKKSYLQIVKQIESLKMEAEKLRKQEISGVIGRIRDAIDRVTEALSAIATATAWAAAATLITGFVVLIGAAAAGERDPEARHAVAACRRGAAPRAWTRHDRDQGGRW